MALWLILGGLTLLAVLWPLYMLRRQDERGKKMARRLDYDLDVYEDQLAEVARDLERGVIDEKEAEAARREIQRRMLAARRQAQTPEGSAPPAPSAAKSKMALAAVVALPLLGGLYYLQTGAPELAVLEQEGEASPGPAMGGETAESGGEGVDMDTALARLSARLDKQPDDVAGWFLLGRSYLVMDRYGEGVAAFRRARALRPEDPLLAAALGEALVLESGGTVIPEARNLFGKVAAQRPDEPRAQFYLGMAEAQAGRPKKALEIWSRLAAASPPDAPWREDLRRRMAALAEETGIDLGEMAAATPPPNGGSGEGGDSAASGPRVSDGTALSRVPTAEERATVGAMSAEDQAAFIRDRVTDLAARLEAQPDDPRGWVMLARSYDVLGENSKAEEALARALVYDPQNRDALLRLGEAAARDGRRLDAATYWGRLLGQLSADDPLYKDIEARLEALRAEN